MLDQETVGGTVAHYPRQKLVMTEPVELPLVGKFGKRHISKEELLATWKKAIVQADIRVEERTQVTGIEGQDGGFTVETSQGQVRARKVVLAIGRRGTPRKLGVPGEELPKVTYRLIDPAQYEGAGCWWWAAATRRSRRPSSSPRRRTPRWRSPTGASPSASAATPTARRCRSCPSGGGSPC